MDINEPEKMIGVPETRDLIEDRKEDETSFRQLNQSITMLGALSGMAVPQNKLFSERSNEPIPDDIRANKKDGDEYDTIGDILRKGGKRKAILIAAAVLFIVLMIIHGMITWGGLGSALDLVFEY